MPQGSKAVKLCPVKPSASKPSSKARAAISAGLSFPSQKVVCVWKLDFIACHLFLLYFVVDNVAAFQFGAYIVQTYAQLQQHNHHVVCQVRDLVDCLSAVVVLCGNDDLGTLLAYLFENLVYTPFKQIAGVGALFFLAFTSVYKLHESVKVKGTVILRDKHRIVKAALRPSVACRAVLVYQNR